VARASGLTILTKLAKLAGLITIVGVLAAGFLVPYIGGIGLVAKAGADKFLSTKCTLPDESVQQKSTMYASDGKTVIATFFDQNRVVVPLTQIPKTVIDALISTEDRRFYDHHGVDMRGLIRGALKTGSGNTQGASTLTEQYVKQANYYDAISNNDNAAALAAIDQNLDRKISDAQCALDIEKKNTKSQILEKYLNIAFFGENSYGIQTAAQTFFGVPASKLSIPQAALLVGLVKSPTSLDPFVPDQVQKARDRRDLVIDNMASQNYITAAQATQAKASPIKLSKQSVPARGCSFADNNTILNVGFFCDYAYQWLTSVGGLSPQKINTNGLKIVTTIDPARQNQVQASLTNDMKASLDYDKANGRSPSAAIMPGLDPTTGYIKFFATSRQYGSGGNNKTMNPIFTHATSGSGSTFKYFTAVSALKLGAPDSYRLTTGDYYHTKNCPAGTDPQGGYHNAGNYAATMSLKSALIQSSNTYFVGMEDMTFDCNLSYIVQTAKDLGYNTLNAPDPRNNSGRPLAENIVDSHEATFTLGQHPVSPLELASAYSAAANDGVLCPPTPIISITALDGRKVPFKRLPCARKLDSFTARTVVNIMTGDTTGGQGGTATSAFANWAGGPVAGKTGTNNGSINGSDSGNNAALWFVGSTPNLVATTAIYNPDAPTHDILDAPDHFGQAGNAFGAVAAGLWAHALAPSEGTMQWQWPNPLDVPNGVQVPTVFGQSPADATTTLTQAGFKVRVLTTQTCGSSYAEGTVGMFGPSYAAPGDTITLCMSSGKPAVVYIAPPTKKPSKSPASPTPTHGRPRR
jgi:membrane peptidoglycan carboxypeptidase